MYLEAGVHGVGLTAEGGTAGGLNFRICFSGVLGSAFHSISASFGLSGVLTDLGLLLSESEVSKSDAGLLISDFGELGVGVRFGVGCSRVRVSTGHGRAIFCRRK